MIIWVVCYLHLSKGKRNISENESLPFPAVRQLSSSRSSLNSSFRRSNSQEHYRVSKTTFRQPIVRNTGSECTITFKCNPDHCNVHRAIQVMKTSLKTSQLYSINIKNAISKNQNLNNIRSPPKFQHQQTINGDYVIFMETFPFLEKH